MIVRVPSPGGEPVTAGPGAPTRVMALTGVTHLLEYDAQAEKIDALTQIQERPDIIADLSIVSSQRPLWKRVLDAECATATLPVYTAILRNSRIDTSELLDIALEQLANGVGLLTIHPTATRELVDAAQKRIVPWTSRGGGLIITDLLASHDPENAYRKILPDLVPAALRHGAVLSIGATFRSSNIFDSLDQVQQAEIEAQLKLASEIARAGVGVIIESPGHARPSDIIACARRFAQSGFPIMPLGPIPTDTAIGWDHVAAAIGATLMGIEGGAHILAAVTREEHTGNVPTRESTIEAVHTARVAAHVIDIHQLGITEGDARVVGQRAESHTCVAGKRTAGCSRCATTCPLERHQ